MEAWIEYNQGRLPYDGSIASQDYVVLKALQTFSSEKNRIELEAQEREEKKAKSKRLTMEAKSLAKKGGGLPTGIRVSGGEA